VDEDAHMGEEEVEGVLRAQFIGHEVTKSNADLGKVDEVVVEFVEVDLAVDDLLQEGEVGGRSCGCSAIVLLDLRKTLGFELETVTVTALIATHEFVEQEALLPLELEELEEEFPQVLSGQERVQVGHDLEILVAPPHPDVLVARFEGQVVVQEVVDLGEIEVQGRRVAEFHDILEIVACLSTRI
jgi:hypothetical protein